MEYRKYQLSTFQSTLTSPFAITLLHCEPPIKTAERASTGQKTKMRLLSAICLTLITFGGSVLQAANGSKIKHVLVISIDGMYSQDLAKWVAANPGSTLASLNQTG